MQAIQAFPTGPARPRPAAGIAVLCVHAGLLWALLQLDVVHDTLRRVATEVAPLMVTLVASAGPEAQAPALQLPAVTTPPPAPRPLDVPAVDWAPRVATVPAADPVARPLPAESAAPAPLAVQAAPAPVVAAAPQPPLAAAPTPPTPPAPRRLAAGALRYLVQPAVVVPRLSRRAGEQGTVLLHVVVDVQGLPKAVSVRSSSGYPRLDEQALAAMRAARFVPCTDDGRPVECEADAPIVYELQP